MLNNRLRKKYGRDNVIASDVRIAPASVASSGPFTYLDIVDSSALSRIVVDNSITTVIHLVAILSGTGELNPQLALKINNQGTENVFEVCRTHKLKVFVPSTIAVFGPSSPKFNTPDDCILRPTTMYGLTKVHTELLGEYYCAKYGLDFRSLRYPGVISAHGLPGGGTTDYAVDIYHKAILENKYTCFLTENTSLPMIYMPDLLRATLDLMDADPAKLKRRVYNLGALSFTPKDLTESIQKLSPGFKISYEPDFRQKIADSWPSSLDDSNARADWGWKPQYDVPAMTADMLKELKIQYKK